MPLLDPVTVEEVAKTRQEKQPSAISS